MEHLYPDLQHCYGSSAKAQKGYKSKESNSHSQKGLCGIWNCMEWKLHPHLTRNVNAGYWIERVPCVLVFPHCQAVCKEFHETQTRKPKKGVFPFSFMEIYRKEYGWEIADPLCQMYPRQVGTLWQQPNYRTVTRMIFIWCLPRDPSRASHQSLIFFSLISIPRLGLCSLLISS